MRPLGVAAMLLLCANAASAADLRTCASIVDNAERLACYDRIVSTETGSPAVPQAAIVAPAAVQASEPPAPAAAAAPAPVDQAAAFGAETVPRTEVDVSGTLHARMLGAFTGWRPGMVVELDNGQTWKSIDNDRQEHDPIQAPQITIEKGLMNYWMKVEGMHRGFKVRRIH
ncbi:MAG: hypothetical protein E6R07_10970 [Nevskiaceae bacterium]|nr:MAG: hypothetical protein E6R07_10970 [Nevskiaceae bacterium]